MPLARSLFKGFGFVKSQGPGFVDAGQTANAQAQSTARRERGVEDENKVEGSKGQGFAESNRALLNFEQGRLRRKRKVTGCQLSELTLIRPPQAGPLIRRDVGHGKIPNFEWGASPGKRKVDAQDGCWVRL